MIQNTRGARGGADACGSRSVGRGNVNLRWRFNTHNDIPFDSAGIAGKLLLDGPRDGFRAGNTDRVGSGPIAAVGGAIEEVVKL